MRPDDARRDRQPPAQPDRHAPRARRSSPRSSSSSSATARRSSATRSTAASSTIPPRGCPPPPTARRAPSAWACSRSRMRWPGCASAGWRRATATCWPPSRRCATTRRSAARRPPRCSASSRCAPRMRCSSAAAASSPPTCRSWTTLFAAHAERLDWVRPTAGLDRLPALPRRRGHRRLQRAARARAGRAAAARAGVRLRRRALPPGLRAQQPPRGGRAARPAAARMSDVRPHRRRPTRRTRRPDPRIEQQIAARPRRCAQRRQRRRRAPAPTSRATARLSPSSPRPVMLAQRAPGRRARGTGLGGGAAVRRPRRSTRRWPCSRCTTGPTGAAGVAEMRRVAPQAHRDAHVRPRVHRATTGSCATTCPRSPCRTRRASRRCTIVAEALGGAEIAAGADRARLQPTASSARGGSARSRTSTTTCARTSRASRRSLPATVAEALERLERDVADGTWAERNATLLALDEADFGYRLLVATVRRAPSFGQSRTTSGEGSTSPRGRAAPRDALGLPPGAGWAPGAR